VFDKKGGPINPDFQVNLPALAHYWRICLLALRNIGVDGMLIAYHLIHPAIRLLVFMHAGGMDAGRLRLERYPFIGRNSIGCHVVILGGKKKAACK
jgi:hypothetical protein